MQHPWQGADTATCGGGEAWQSTAFENKSGGKKSCWETHEELNFSVNNIATVVEGWDTTQDPVLIIEVDAEMTDNKGQHHLQERSWRKEDNEHA